MDILTSGLLQQLLKFSAPERLPRNLSLAAAEDKFANQFYFKKVIHNLELDFLCCSAVCL